MDYENTPDARLQIKELENVLAGRFPDRRPKTFTAAELQRKEFPEVQWAVPELMPEGLTLLAGAPKMGKSWMMLSIGVAVASGGYALGQIKVKQRGVLYLALEDNERRIKKRMNKLLPDGDWPEGLNFGIDWGRTNEGGIEHLRHYLDSHRTTGLIIIDTLARFRSNTSSKNQYQTDYDAMTDLHKVASQYQVSIIVVHHIRQLTANDPMEEISGTSGLTGAADGWLILKRERFNADAVLHIDGRDIENNEPRALKWDALTAQWTLIGMAEEYRNSQEQQKILNALKGNKMTAKELAAAIEMPYHNVRQIIYRMESEKKVRREGGNQAKGYKYVAVQEHYNHNNHHNQEESSNSCNGCNAHIEDKGHNHVWEYQLNGDPTLHQITLNTDDHSKAWAYMQMEYGENNIRTLRRVDQS